jgi:hypothetical protein
LNVSFDVPIDHAELCARVRFRLDEPSRLPPGEAKARERHAKERVARYHRRGVRVTSTLTPGLFARLEEVRERLLLPTAPALYIHSSGELNASACWGGNACVMTATSSLVNLLTIEEFGAIIGHEVAHIGLQHAPRDVETPIAELFELEQSRAGEVSCDRLAVIACGSPRVAISALLKVVSGLLATHITLDVEAFLRQLADDPGQVDSEWEAMQTHPLLPFRVWAMHRFCQSDVCRSLLGLEGGEPIEVVEDEICARFKTVGDGLTGRLVTDHLHEALAWTAVLLITEDGSHTDAELAVLSSVAGSVWAEDAMQYLRAHGASAVEIRAKASLGALAYAGKPVHHRVRAHLEALVVRLDATKSRNRVEQLLDAAWSG